MPAHVEPDDRVDLLERAVLDHARRAALPVVVERFLGRLEEEPDRALRQTPGVPLGDEQPGGADQPGGVEVVPARVHHVRDGRAVVVVRLFLDGERVHVGAQRHDGALPVLDVRGHAGASDAPPGREPQRGEPVGHDRRRPMLLEGELGMAMQVAPELHKLGCQGTGAIHQGHVSFCHRYPRKLVGETNIAATPVGARASCPIHD